MTRPWLLDVIDEPSISRFDNCILREHKCITKMYAKKQCVLVLVFGLQE